MKIIEGPKIPTPFGEIKLPDLETPPIELPTIPSPRAGKAIGHGIGEDLAQIVGIVPFIGAFIEDALEDMHHVEIKKILTADEYDRFANYNKSLPTSLALARTLCFRKV